MERNTFKVVLVGNAGVGKSAFVKRHSCGDFEKKYIATMGVEVTPLRFKTNYGEYVLNIWDCAGSEKFRGLGDGYYVSSDAAICMFSLDDKLSMINISKWLRDIKRMCADIPTIIAGSKYDLPNLQVTSNTFGDSFRTLGYPMFEISSKNNEVIVTRQPIVEILKTLTGHNDLVIY